MSKKKLNILLNIIFLLLINILLVHFVSSMPSVSISNYEANGGDLYTTDNSFDLDITLRNSGNSCAFSAIVTAEISPPFMNDESPTSDSRDICPGSKTVAIPLKLQQDTVGGSYPLKLTVTYADDANNIYSFTNTITVFIKGKSEINANIINSNPLKIYSGDTVTLSVLIENDGTFKAESIKGTLFAIDPLTIISSNSFNSISSLEPLQSSIAEFSVEIPKDAQAQLYPMTLSLQYTEDGKTKTKRIPLTLNVEKKALFEADSSGVNKFYINSEGKTLRMNIKNTGTDVANSIKIQVQPQFPFTTDGSIRYIDRLGIGESKSVQFVVNIDKSATIGDYALDFIINYKDSQGNILTDTITSDVSVEKQNLFQIIFVNYWYLWLIGELILLIIFTRISKRRKVA